MFGARTKSAKLGRFSLSDVVLYFEDEKGHRYPWTIRDACEGTQIFGATGTGKSSGSGRTIAIAMLLARFGGLVLTAKPEDCALWQGYVRETGREADLIIVQPCGQFHCNILRYEHEHTRGGAPTFNLAALLRIAMEGGRERESTTDPYWEDAVNQLIVNAIDTQLLATDSVSLPGIAKVIRTAPTRRTDVQSPMWRDKSLCWKYLTLAQERALDAASMQDLEETANYWCLDHAGLADRTRSVVVSSFTSKATTILRRPLRALFCNDAPDTFSPADSHRGKIIVLNLPIKEYGEAARFAQVIFKTAWQRATERREVTPSTPPVFLWADESQYFVTSQDVQFQQTARSKLAATVYLTQNISSYYAAMPARAGHAATDSLLGNLQTKIFHAQGDPATNEYAERLFAKEIQTLRSSGITSDSVVSRNTQESYQPVVPANVFTTLRKGGPENNRIIDGVIFQAGRRWDSSGAHYLLAQFRQSS